MPQSVLPHLVDAQLGRASEAVLDAPQDAVHIMLVAFKLKHGVYNMFQHLGAGYAALLIYMSDEDDRRVGLFGKTKDGGGAFPYLGDASR